MLSEAKHLVFRRNNKALRFAQGDPPTLLGRLTPFSVFVLLPFFLFSVFSCAPAPTPRAKTQLTLIGADAMQPLMKALASAFMKQRPDVNITLQPANSAIGVRAPLESPRTIGLVSRALKPSEAGNLRAVPIARDGIAIVVNRNNPINAIQREQVAQVFAGEVSAWPTGPVAGKPIIILSREDGSGTRTSFEALAMQNKRVTRAALVLASDDAVVEYIVQNPQAIGYASMGALNEKVHTLAVDDTALSRETVENQQYPYGRTFWLVVPLETELDTQEFIDFVLSAAGQRIVTEKYAGAP